MDESLVKRDQAMQVRILPRLLKGDFYGQLY